MAMNGNEHGEWLYPLGTPTSITPAPAMIQVPRACPEGVRSEVEVAFALYWADLASSLNRIRNALELVLTDLGIARSVLSKKKPKPGVPVSKGKRIRLSLHNRIGLLEKKRPKLKEICERMMAVKHLGNAGSHPGLSVEHNDVFDGMDILERVLNDMYSEHPRALTKTVREINKRRGPRKSGK